jgi:xanthine/CO dehydrogenase XdhC/CoxF family maturation factor
MNTTADRSIASDASLRWDRDVKSPIHPPLLGSVLWTARVLALLPCLLGSAFCKAQDLGQVECARAGDYVYLYSSMITLDIRGTLQCGQQVEITGRYDLYFGVRTAKGETGYVPQDSLLLLKNTPGAKPVLPPTKEPAREKIHYDQPSNSADAPSKALDSTKTLLLLDSTPIRMKIDKTISSADAQVGDEVSFEVTEDVVIDGFLVVPKGATAIGVVNEAEPKKSLGRGGKLSVLVRSVRMANNDQVVVRSGGEGKGSSTTAGVVIPVMHGKDITFPKGMEFTAYVNGDTRLKRDNFHPAPQIPDAPPSGTVSNIQRP